MKKLLVMVSFSLFVKVSYQQKLYVWCPKEQETKPRIGFLNKDTINVVIFDGRVLTKNSKIECNSSDIIASLITILKNTYTSAAINILDQSGYYSDPDSNRVTIKIGIAAFHAGFGADISIGIGSVGGNFSYGVFPKGEWNAITGYYVRLYDCRQGKTDKYTTAISKISSKPNMLGYKSAKTCLNITYMEANQEMLFFIDNNLMK